MSGLKIGVVGATGMVGAAVPRNPLSQFPAVDRASYGSTPRRARSARG